MVFFQLDECKPHQNSGDSFKKKKKKSDAMKLGNDNVSRETKTTVHTRTPCVGDL